MGAANQIDIVLFGEGRYDFLTKGEGNTTVIFAPSLDVLVGVGPEEIAEESGVGDVCGSHDSLNLLEGGKLWGETAVHAEDLLIDNSSDRQAVEAVSEGLPQLYVVAALAFVVEPVNTVD
jgi:hypothetical protein